MYTSSAIRYFLYARKSSESEDRQVQSIDDQKAVLLRFAGALNLNVIANFEEAHSAKEPDTRQVFKDMLKRIEMGEADGILCWQINRLSRNPVDSGKLSWLLQKGVVQSIRTVDREYRPEDNVLIMAVETATSTQYIIDLSKNVKRALDEKAARGSWPMRPKPGYCSVPKTIGNKTVLETDKDPEQFHQLRKAWDLMLSGAYTVPQVLRRLDQSGFRLRATNSRPVRPIPRTMLYRIFHSPFYYGYFTYKGALIRGHHPPMVSKAEFGRVQEILRRSDTKPQKHEFAFSGLIRCGVCGCLVTPDRKIKHYKTTGRTAEYVYYHCSGYRGCRKDGIQEAMIHAEIAKLLEAWRLDLEFLSLTDLVLNRYRSAEGEVLDQVDGNLRRKFTAAKERVDRLFEMRQAGEITAAEFAERKAIYQNEVSRLDQEITESMMSIRNNSQALQSAVIFLVEAPREFPEASVSSKREIAALLAKQYILTKEKQLKIVPDPLLERIQTFEPLKEPDHQIRGGQSTRSDLNKPANKFSTKYPTFEPVKRRENMVRQRGKALSSSDKRRWCNHLLNLITGQKVSFGKATK